MATRQPVESVWLTGKQQAESFADIKAKTLKLLTTYQATTEEALRIRLRNKIVVLNEGLVGRVARRFQDKCETPLDDLRQIGFEGLIKAVENFDLSTGHAFSSYAVPKIEGAIKHYLRDNRSIAKVPRRWGEAADQARRVQQLLERAGRTVSVEEAAVKGVGLDDRRWEWIATATSSASTRSMEELEMFEVPDESGTEAAEAELQATAWAAVTELLSEAKEPAKTYIVEHFYHGLDHHTIACRHGQVRSQIEQKISAALQEIRNGIAREAT